MPPCFTHYLPKLNQLNQQTLLHYPLNHESRAQNWINTIYFNWIKWINWIKDQIHSTYKNISNRGISVCIRGTRISLHRNSKMLENQGNWINWIKVDSAGSTVCYWNNTIPHWINWIKDSNLHYVALWQPRSSAPTGWRTFVRLESSASNWVEALLYD